MIIIILYIYHTISYNNNGSKISAIIDRAFQHCSAFDVCRRLICKCSSNSRSAGFFVEGTANAGDRVHREHTETNKHMFPMYNHGWIKPLLNKICSKILWPKKTNHEGTSKLLLKRQRTYSGPMDDDCRSSPLVSVAGLP